MHVIIWGCSKLYLSQTFRALSLPSRIGTGNLIMFSRAYFVKKMQEDCIKTKKLETHESVPVHRVDGIGQASVPVRNFDFWTLVLHSFSLNRFSSCNAAE